MIYLGFPEGFDDVLECGEPDDDLCQVKGKEHRMYKCGYECKCPIGEVVYDINVEEHIDHNLSDDEELE